MTRTSRFRLAIRNWLVSTGDSGDFRSFEPSPEHAISPFGSSAKLSSERQLRSLIETQLPKWTTQGNINFGSCETGEIFSRTGAYRIAYESLRTYVGK